jgi:hypothetical protein
MHSHLVDRDLETPSSQKGMVDPSGGDAGSIAARMGSLLTHVKCCQARGLVRVWLSRQRQLPHVLRHLI